VSKKMIKQTCVSNDLPCQLGGFSERVAMGLKYTCAVVVQHLLKHDEEAYHMELPRLCTIVPWRKELLPQNCSKQC